MNYDIFNGDADGIIALLQLRLATPQTATLITGVKRDINLLAQLPTTSGEDSVTVLDISMVKNSKALHQLIDSGADVFYADHHQSGEIPQADNLDAHIDLAPNTCTGLIVDKLLNGKYHAWAITAAYGDNLLSIADALADTAGFDALQKSQLKELGTLINYNGYGEQLEDLHFHPADLYQALLQYSSPFAVIDDHHSPFYVLQQAYQDDIKTICSLAPFYQSSILSVFSLPNTATSRRISGVFGNQLANESPNSAHAVLTENSDGSFKVSLRAPLNNKRKAGEICSQFPTGGGREAAAGINALPAKDITRFIEAVTACYQ
ncbi:DHH family phosphoesterase [Vibrio cortegadensis]|uniref:DHHA1 domain-containing protein n=1 Tax=Vibrio cortegadensis TaxID=1328770 RepID=UPI0021C31109|nr:DHH family phosphoesterase [Vibrio cortegadensis]MDN3696401.1 DHH family phosphoesterase [Vibrio cortegadensis]